MVDQAFGSRCLALPQPANSFELARVRSSSTSRIEKAAPDWNLSNSSQAIGAATGAPGMAAAIGGGTAVASEALLVSVEKDAKQAAKAVAERIIQGYKERGWLRP